jgi:vacuolar-type H+-ATPase subunit E/Vma4
MRLKVLDAKQGGLADVLDSAKDTLGDVSKGNKYSEIIQRLIVQVSPAPNCICVCVCVIFCAVCRG